MAASKTYFPSKTFDDDLDSLVQLALEAGWSFTGVDFDILKEDAITQRTDRAAYDKAVLKLAHLREQFGIDQQARYHRFANALNAARGAFRQDKATMAQLNRFRRASKRPAKTSD